MKTGLPASAPNAVLFTGIVNVFAAEPAQDPNTGEAPTRRPMGSGAAIFLLTQGTSNAAAGTNTLTCNLPLPLGAQLVDINLFVGSQTTAPTSLGTATLGSVTFPAGATTETAMGSRSKTKRRDSELAKMAELAKAKLLELGITATYKRPHYLGCWLSKASGGSLMGIKKHDAFRLMRELVAGELIIPKPSEPIKIKIGYKPRKKPADLSWWQRYQRYINSAKWITFRASIVDKRGARCEDCGAFRCELHLHHLTYERMGAEIDSDVRLLCIPCHQVRHPNRRIEAVAS